MSSVGPTRRPWTTGEQGKLDELLKAGKTDPEIATALQRNLNPFIHSYIALT